MNKTCFFLWCITILHTNTYTPFLEDFNSDKHAHFAEDFQLLFTNANFLQIINCLFSVQKPLYTVQY